jgi:hypothetical protein
MRTRQFQKWTVTSTETQKHKRENYPGNKTQKQSELSPDVLYVNPGINTIFQKNIGAVSKFPAAQREQHQTRKIH